MAQHRATPTIVFFHGPLQSTIAGANLVNHDPVNYMAQPHREIRAILRDNPQVFLWASGPAHLAPMNANYHHPVSHYQARFFAAQSLQASGEAEEADAAYRRAYDTGRHHLELNPDDARAATMCAVSACRIGRREEGLEWAERAVAADPEDAGVRYNVACLYALEGEPERAITALEDAFEVGFGNRDWIERDPDLDSLRSHPRFHALLARLTAPS